MSERLEVGGLAFEVRRSRRRKTLGITVDRGGKLVLHAPETTPEAEIIRWARSKLLWVHRKLALKKEDTPRVREPDWVSGESFRYLGRSYQLKVVPAQDRALRFDGRRFYLRKDARAGAEESFRRWYSAVGTPWITKRVGLLSHRAGGQPSGIEVRDLGYRWGSCGKNRVLLFNWRLFQLPVRLVDYVIAHELEHLVRPHHDPEFWNALARSLPDWREREEELKREAADVFWCQGEMVRGTKHAGLAPR